MNRHLLLALMVVALSGCGDSEESVAESAAPTARATALVRTADFSGSEMKMVERRYVDGVALRTSDSAAVLLSATPMDACTRLAVLVRGSTDFGPFASAEAPALALVRNEEYPQGSVHFLEQGSTTYLSQTLPSLQADGDRFIAKGVETEYAPTHLEYDVDLPYASMAEFDPLVADAGPEAGWLRALVEQADADTEAVVAATFFENEADWNSYSARSSWFDVLGNWDNFNVIAAASGAECATLVVQMPGFSGGSRKAVIRARGPADQRKVFAAETSDDNAEEGSYVVGRVEHPTFGAFPIMAARAEEVADLGTVVIFSERPLGDASWEQLAQTQRVVRAVAGSSFGNNYMFGSLEFAGPGKAAETIPAQTISNAYIDETSIAGLVKQGEAGEPRIVVNFRAALKASAATP